ncbi:hypothetical protein ACJX0J_031133, partial [Zea mays]
MVIPKWIVMWEFWQGGNVLLANHDSQITKIPYLISDFVVGIRIATRIVFYSEPNMFWSIYHASFIRYTCTSLHF